MATQADTALHLGTCSWKYPSWRGLVYSDAANPHYLQEYARRYDAVEIDQWFWSLFGPDKVVLPQPKVVAEYAAAVPEGFRFGVKLPNALTLTHFHQKAKTDPLVIDLQCTVFYLILPRHGPANIAARNNCCRVFYGSRGSLPDVRKNLCVCEMSSGSPL